MNKYYQPKIEEFRVGFECRFKNVNELNSKWEDVTIDNFLLQLKLSMSDKKAESYFKVKYLSKECIESLGWELKDSNYNCGSKCNLWEKNSSVFTLNGNPLTKEIYTLYFKEGYVKIVNNHDGVLINTIKVKNKSELKQIMKMLEI